MCAPGDEALQRLRVLSIVFGDHPAAGIARCRLHGGLVVLGQHIPSVHVDEHVLSCAARPPGRVVVVFRDLVEAELLVVVGPDKLHGIDGAFFEGRVDVPSRDLLRDHAELGDDRAGEACDPHFEALQILDFADLLAKPTPHLGSGIAHRDEVALKARQDFLHQIVAAAVHQPRLHLSRVEAERQ